MVVYVNERDGYKVWVSSKHRIMKSPNIELHPEKLCTTNTVELKFHPPEDDRHDVNSQNAFEDEFHSALEDGHISESDSGNDVIIFRFLALFTKLSDQPNLKTMK